MRIVFMGTPEFSVSILNSLVLNKHQIVAVYTQPDRPSGRGRALAPPPLKKTALALDLPVFQPDSLKGLEVAGQLVGFNPEAIIVAAFGQILPKSVLEIPKYGCVNVHPSLLPKYRGASPVVAAILAGDVFTGVSIMRMDAGMDTGPVFVQAQIPISAQDTTGSMTAKLSCVAAHLLQEVLIGLERGEISSRPQDNEKANYSGSFDKKDGEIDWGKPAEEIWRRVRAFNPWPGCYTRWQGKQLRIIEATPLPGDGVSKVGEVIAVPTHPREPKPAFGVRTGEGVLGISKLQLEGKQAMTSADFLRGQRQFIGSVLSSE